jgi:ankyrin repeat protein
MSQEHQDGPPPLRKEGRGEKIEGLMDYLSMINLMFGSGSADVGMGGFTVADVHAKLEGVTIESVKENVDHLVDEGWLYTTIDEDHFLGTQWSLLMDGGESANLEEEPRASGEKIEGLMDFLSMINLMFGSADVGMRGFTVADVHAKLEGVTIETVKENVDQLMNEGELYTTIDEDHFQVTSRGPFTIDDRGESANLNTEEEPRAAGAAGITQAASNGTIKACCAGDVEAVRRLLEAGADKEKATTNGCTPLYVACEDGHVEVVRLLVEAGADKEKAETNGYTPLLVACEDGHVEVVRLLVAAGADKEKAAADGFTPLLVACQRDHIEVVQLLVEAGADKDNATTDGFTSLLIACQHGYVEVVRLLVEAGADKEKAAADGCTSLLIACQSGHVEVVRLLVEAGADKEKATTDGFTSLLIACQSGHVEVLRLLVEAGADKEKAETNGYTPLLSACEDGHVEVVRLLVEAGADKEKAETDGFTPLLVACQHGHVEVVWLLVEAGADKEKATANGYTPLHLTALHGHDTICMLLIFKGTDLTARAVHNNQTPADVAQSSGHTSLAAHLRSTNGVHCLRCMGPSLERRLLWNDTNQQQQEMMLDEMQAQWLARVAEGCAHARVGLTLRGAFSGGLSTDMLLHVMGYVFGGTQVHLQSCISMGRVAPEKGLVAQAVAVVDVHGAKNARSDRGRPMQHLHSVQHDQEPLPPKLALVSHAMALVATPNPHPIISSFTGAGSPVLGAEARQQLQTALTRLIAAATAADGGCEWLHAYCDFLQRRHRLGS